VEYVYTFLIFASYTFSQWYLYENNWSAVRGSKKCSWIKSLIHDSRFTSFFFCSKSFLYDSLPSKRLIQRFSENAQEPIQDSLRNTTVKHDSLNWVAKKKPLSFSQDWRFNDYKTFFFLDCSSHWKFHKKKKTILRDFIVWAEVFWEVLRKFQRKQRNCFEILFAHQENKTKTWLFIKAFPTQCDNPIQTKQRFKVFASYSWTYLEMQQQLARNFLNIYSKSAVNAVKFFSFDLLLQIEVMNKKQAPKKDSKKSSNFPRMFGEIPIHFA